MALSQAEQVLDYMLQAIEGAAPAGCEVPLIPSWQQRRLVTVVTSIDPNDKLGPIGVGGSGLIGNDDLLPYSVRFENLETATAPAQEVLIVDPLDVATLDLSTLTLGPIAFGSHTVVPPPGLKSFSTDVDLRPEQDLIVRISAGLDLATGVLTWSLNSIDPATGLLPDDPLAGFLPPNLTPPEGDGSVLFAVKPLSALPGGTPIRNSATIDFDGASLVTPEWANELDTTPPASQVLPLTTTQDSASFTVRWEAAGPPPDLHDYSVYVSEDGGPFRPWRVHTTVTADTIVAPGWKTYSFYSLARDSSGNMEAVPPTPDTQTYSRVSAPSNAPLALSLTGAVPNPVTGDARVWFTLPTKARAVLDVWDVAGRRMLRMQLGEFGVGRHSVDVTSAVRRPGLYFIRLKQGDVVRLARMVVIR